MGVKHHMKLVASPQLYGNQEVQEALSDGAPKNPSEVKPWEQMTDILCLNEFRILSLALMFDSDDHVH